MNTATVRQGFDAAVHYREEDHLNRWPLANVDGPLWKGLRQDALALLRRAKDEINIRMNALMILHWFDYKFHKESGRDETILVEGLLKNSEVCLALWAAATVTPLNPRYVGELHDFPTRVKELGIILELPRWWNRALVELGIKKDESKTAALD